MKTSTKRTKKPARKTVTKRAPRNVDRPVPYVPTEAKREPLAPLTGKIGPEPEVEDRDLAAERVVLRGDGSDRGDGMPLLGQVLSLGLSWDRGDEPGEIALATLRRFEDELRVMHAALLNPDDVDTQRAARVAFSMAKRADMVIRLCDRMNIARGEPSKLAPPPAHIVAALCLALPGVPSGTSTRDRMHRIAERLGVEVVTSGLLIDRIEASIVEDKATNGEKGFSRIACRMLYRYVEPREGSILTKKSIVLFPSDRDQDRTFAEGLALAVSKRDGYKVDNDWITNFADTILDRAVQKGAA